MADLNVQPKRKSSILWVILALIAIVLIFTLVRGCSGTKTTSDHVEKDSTATTQTPQ